MPLGNSATGSLILTDGVSSRTIQAYTGSPAGAVSGQAGDLIMSSDGKTYVCTGSTNWTQSVTSSGMFAGYTTVYVDAIYGTDTVGAGTLNQPYQSINYAYGQVASLGLVPATTSGTATGTQTTTTLQDTSQSWAVNQYAGYTLVLLSGTGSGQTATVVSNTSNTLTISAPWATTPVSASTTYMVYSQTNVNRYITEKLIIQIAPGRYTENVVLGFKRARVQLVGNGVQIIGTVQLRVNRNDFPAAYMEAIKSTFPAPWTNASTQNTFELTGGALGGIPFPGGGDGGGVEADSTADPFFVTGVSSLLFNEATVPGTIATGLAWENYYGQFNFYANKVNLIGGMVISTAYVSTPTRALPTCTIEIDASTIGEASSPVRTYLGGVPYPYLSGSLSWNLGTGAATAISAIGAFTLTDSTKAWTTNQWAGSTVTITSGSGVSQTRTVTSNTATVLTVSVAWATALAVGSTYSLIGTTNKVGEGSLTMKAHNSTLGASVGPRLIIGEIDGCRLYDLDRTMLGTVDNGAVTGSISSSYVGMVINQFRQYSGTGIAPSQYQLGSASAVTRFKIDSTSYTTLYFNRSSSNGSLTARTINITPVTGTATSATATTLVDTTKTWTVNQWANGVVTITGGTGSGQIRTISSNTATALTVSVAWAVTPDATSTYSIATTVFDFQDESRSLAYTPTTSANWVAPAPATVQAALDRLAAAVFTLRGNSAIP